MLLWSEESWKWHHRFSHYWDELRMCFTEQYPTKDIQTMLTQAEMMLEVASKEANDD